MSVQVRPCAPIKENNMYTERDFIFAVVFVLTIIAVMSGIFYHAGYNNKVCPDNKSLTLASRQDNCSRCWRCGIGVCCEPCE